MSSLSGDEGTEISGNEPVRRTRSGRAVKTVTPATGTKKTPVKKTPARVTRAARNIQEIEEENNAQLQESEMPENGVQQGMKEHDASIQLKLDETQEQMDTQVNQGDMENENQDCAENINQFEAVNENQDEQMYENEGEMNEDQQMEEYQDQQGNVEGEMVPQQEADIAPEQEGDMVPYQEGETAPDQEGDMVPYQEGDIVPDQEGDMVPYQEGETAPNQEGDMVSYQEDDMAPDQEGEMAPDQGDIVPDQEGEPIAEFDPDEVNQDENVPEGEVLAEPMCTDEIPLDNENTLQDGTSVQAENMDDQCILIEDDTDQPEGTEQSTNVNGNNISQIDDIICEDPITKIQKTNKSQNRPSRQDNENKTDYEQFENDDVEFISESKRAVEPVQEEDPQEIIEISDSETGPKKSEPDTEAVSEDELPTEAAAKHFDHECEDVEEVSEDEFFPNETVCQEPETEAVSDEELPAAQPADLGETESVSEDELPLESEKKKKSKPSSKGSEKKSKSDINKRKRPIEGEYDPSSPTSENNDETPAKKAAMSADVDSSDKSDAKPVSPKKKILPELEKYWKAVNDDPTDFTGWTYLLQYVDQENDAEAAREAYGKFLERYPYCYGYWRKYADYEKKKGDPERVQTVFDQGLKSISLSVDLWLHYINHCKVVHEKDEEKMRKEYERAINSCGLEFRSDRLWESYIKWELDNKRYNKVMNIYDRLLVTPTLGYMTHFETFQEFVTSNSPNKILNVDDFLTLRAEVKSLLKPEDSTAADDAPPGEDLPNEKPPSDEETRAIREKIISSRRKMHKTNVNAVAARWTFEEGIKRPYFHVKPLERCQLKNWKEYLDYEIEQKDQKRIIILFERCLIACALYDEFWMRFVRFLESLKEDNEEKIRDVYTRACTVHHPKKPNLHLQWATFEESEGNYDKAASILENIDNTIPNMLQIAYRRINLERRRGDLEKACSLYESYISSSKNRTIANNIVVKYARFLCKIKNDTDRAVKVLIKATEKDKDNPRLYLQLIDLGLQRNPIDVQEVVGYMDLFIDREHADAEQRVLFAQRKVEFLEDFSTDIRQVLRAHEQFQKCIKQAKERKKAKNDEAKSDAATPKKAKVDTSSTAQAAVGSQSYQYGSSAQPYQSQQQFQSGQYGSQGSYQQGYQQYPPPSDPNYANYQNWQYGQSGPQAYAPYNQWGSYNYY